MVQPFRCIGKVRFAVIGKGWLCDCEATLRRAIKRKVILRFELCVQWQDHRHGLLCAEIPDPDGGLPRRHLAATAQKGAATETEGCGVERRHAGDATDPHRHNATNGGLVLVRSRSSSVERRLALERAREEREAEKNREEEERRKRQQEAERRIIEEETARRIEETIRKRVEEALASEDVKKEMEERLRRGRERLLQEVEEILEKERQAALEEAKRKEEEERRRLEELENMLNENQKKVEEAQKRAAEERRRQEEERFKELENLQKQREEEAKRKQQEEELIKIEQMKILGKKNARPKVAFGFGFK
ncbi:hypothetical protein KFL_001330230 [Klebsormidium nitens]|uniref:Uncharacterized protein n=1 Tax=Klebsormidium nitens TaxID=105231 RepID=A0A0U9HUX1_KLENI|nr:hypothetical protein KFL_001330230 [Klebsormidium nitens]|eukprot:GAQ83040.1 hypothetical protein KFL_001330230 [Klebsormidium nitens]